MTTDLSGLKFGRLLVLREHPDSTSRRPRWECICDCGGSVAPRGDSLISGNTGSCGCLRVSPTRTHGLSSTKTYRAWRSMLSRCTNTKDERYHRYGGRGISVDPRWRDFAVFFRDMGERPRGLSLDRRNNDGPYSPENCRWTTPRVQANNTSKVTLFSFGGKRLTLAEWSRETGINKVTLWRRINELKWPLSRAFTESVAR